MKPGDNFHSLKILRLLGVGGMASVYEVYNEGLHRTEALKILKPEYQTDEGVAARFLQEAQLSASLSHPNIVTVYSVGGGHGTPAYYTMELIQGLGFDEILTENPLLTLADVIKILTPVAIALDFSHSKGIIHRDVKPGNIIVSGWPENPQVKVVDFGIASAVSSSNEGRLTKTGMIIGTPEYMSPEQASADVLVGPASDQYSLALMAYEALTGSLPFSQSEGVSSIQILVAKTTKEIPSPVLLNRNISASAASALLKGLSRNPLDRFRNCSGFVSALQGQLPAGNTHDRLNSGSESQKVADLGSSQSGGASNTKTKQKRSPVLLTLGVMGFALVMIAGAYIASTSSRVEKSDKNVSPGTPPAVGVTSSVISVPNLAGLTEDQAFSISTENDFQNKFKSEYNDSVPKGHVIRHNPPANAQKPPGTFVTLVLSDGPEPPMSEPEVKEVFEKWKQAMTSGDASSIASLYHPEAAGNGLYPDGSRKQFNRNYYVNRDLSKLKKIGISSERFVLDGKTGIARFTQSWETDDFGDIGEKELVIRRVGKVPLIYRELMKTSRALPGYASNGRKVTVPNLPSGWQIVTDPDGRWAAGIPSYFRAEPIVRSGRLTVCAFRSGAALIRIECSRGESSDLSAIAREYDAKWRRTDPRYGTESFGRQLLAGASDGMMWRYTRTSSKVVLMNETMYLNYPGVTVSIRTAAPVGDYASYQESFDSVRSTFTVPGWRASSD